MIRALRCRFVGALLAAGLAAAPAIAAQLDGIAMPVDLPDRRTSRIGPRPLARATMLASAYIWRRRLHGQ